MTGGAWHPLPPVEDPEGWTATKLLTGCLLALGVVVTVVMVAGISLLVVIALMLSRHT